MGAALFVPVSRRIARRVAFIAPIVWALLVASPPGAAAEPRKPITNSELSSQLQDLIVQLDKNRLNDTEVQQAIKDFLAAVRTADCRAFTDVIDCLLKNVADDVDRLAGVVPATTLPNQFRPAVNDITAKLKGLLAATPAPPPPVKPVINIIKAYYGDRQTAIRLVDDENQSKLSVQRYLQADDTYRVCVATQAIQTYCQGKPVCPINDGTSAGAKTAANLCGYEPAPYADAINKVLAVQYQCVPEKSLDLTVDPKQIDVDPKLMADANPRVFHARLSETSQIVCAEAPDEAADKPGAKQ